MLICVIIWFLLWTAVIIFWNKDFVPKHYLPFIFLQVQLQGQYFRRCWYFSSFCLFAVCQFLMPQWSVKFYINILFLQLSWFKDASTLIAQIMTFSIRDFFSKCDQIRRKIRNWSHLLKKSLMENFIFCAVSIADIEHISYYLLPIMHMINKINSRINQIKLVGDSL